MVDVLLVTCSDLPDGEYGGHLLIEELKSRDVDAAWAPWDDPRVDWAAARMVAIRSTWDYQDRRTEFLGWARQVESVTQLQNPANVLEWNTDKSYLLELVQGGLPVVPTVVVGAASELPAAIATFGTAVVKPCVGASGRGVVVVDGRQPTLGERSLDVSRLDTGPWIVQPLVESVRTEGETSVFLFGGRAASLVRKVPRQGEIRVQEEFGGRTVPASLDGESVELATQVLDAAERRFDLRLPYARADLMRLDDGRLAVSELEVAEPGLYLDVVPENAAPYVDALVALLGS